MSFGPPQIFPPLPINIPGNQGLVAFQRGTGASYFTQPVHNPALDSKLGPPVEPPFYSPPLNFQQIPNT